MFQFTEEEDDMQSTGVNRNGSLEFMEIEMANKI